ncbi:MAG TPA: cysteine dioxygenase [Burkholderiales bacterium]|nr:cysteine dioxygenase [Burkholderiales bacterium]
MDRAAERRKEIESAVAAIRDIERREGVNPVSLAHIKARLIRLAARTDLFEPQDYPPPEAGQKLRSCLYRLSEDPDHRFALYANASHGGYGTPAHNHTTWAVIVGVTGEEQNRFYDRSPDGGVREKGRDVVRQGTGVAFMPEDLHSIHIEAPLLNFHMYGLALEQLHRREFYKEKEGRWDVFPAHSDIRDARA